MPPDLLKLAVDYGAGCESGTAIIARAWILDFNFISLTHTDQINPLCLDRAI